MTMVNRFTEVDYVIEGKEMILCRVKIDYLSKTLG